MRSPRRGRVDPGRGFGDETVGVMRSGMDACPTLLLTQYHASDGPLYSWIVFPPSTTIP